MNFCRKITMVWGAALWIGALLPAEAANPAVTPAAELAPAVRAYGQREYALAEKYAKAAAPSPERELILALCQVFDQRKDNIAEGQTRLQKLFRNGAIPLPVRLEAGLALARSIRCLHLMPTLRHLSVRRINGEKMLQQIIELAPASSQARDAFFYLAMLRLSDPKRKNHDRDFSGLENFIRDFPGEKKLLAPLHLLAAYEYVRLCRDYRSAVRHLEQGCRIGFSSPADQRESLFRIGFYYFKYLNAPEPARLRLREFRQHYPDAPESAVVRRCLRELEEEK